MFESNIQTRSTINLYNRLPYVSHVCIIYAWFYHMRIQIFLWICLKNENLHQCSTIEFVERIGSFCPNLFLNFQKIQHFPLGKLTIYTKKNQCSTNNTDAKRDSNTKVVNVLWFKNEFFIMTFYLHSLREMLHFLFINS